MNQIGLVSVDALRPLYFDPYSANPRTGCFIVIDAQSNATVGAGMVARAAAPRLSAPPAEGKTAILNAWHDEAVSALRAAGFEVVIRP